MHGTVEMSIVEDNEESINTEQSRFRRKDPGRSAPVNRLQGGNTHGTTKLRAAEAR